ncbi:MAG TPA: hypothetical protein VED21_00365, partial [Azospirillum sp.]|nr:hypothetical protein [Azospirillum sp.]
MALSPAAVRRWIAVCLVALAMPVGVVAIGAGAAVLAAPAAQAQDTGPANRMFVQAMQIIRQADNTLDTAEEARLLKEADKLLADIIAKYPDSALAVQLVTNQFVGDFDFYEFRGRIKALVCNEPLGSLCFLHRVGELLPPVETPITAARWDWLSLAVAYQQLGDPGRAKEIVSPFVSAVRRGKAADSAGQDLFVARALALMGQAPLALDITRQIADCGTRIYNLGDIGKAAAWRGDAALAGALAEEAKQYAAAHGCSWELGIVVQALLRAG